LAVETYRATGAPQRDHQRPDTSVRDEHVRAAAQHPQGEDGGARPLDEAVQLLEARRSRKPASRPADAHVRVTRERLVAHNFDPRWRLDVHSSGRSRWNTVACWYACAIPRTRASSNSRPE